MINDLEALASKQYSGRGISVGLTPKGNSFIGYTITGRSPASQARELLVGKKTSTIYTNVTVQKQLEQGSPALLLYPAVANVNDLLIASNGAQTELIVSAAFRHEHGRINERFALNQDDPCWPGKHFPAASRELVYGIDPETILREALN